MVLVPVCVLYLLLLFFFVEVRVGSRVTRQEETLGGWEKGSTSPQDAARKPPKAEIIINRTQVLAFPSDTCFKVVSEDRPFESHQPQTFRTDSADRRVCALEVCDFLESFARLGWVFEWTR